MKQFATQSTQSFMNYALNEINSQRQNGHYGVAKNRHSALRSLESYLIHVGEDDLPFQKFNVPFVCGFEHWLLHQKEVCRNTSSFYIRTLQAIFNKAVDDGIANGNPFTGVYRGIDKTRKRAVSTSDIRRLMCIDIEKHLLNLYHQQNRRDHGKYFQQTLQKLHFARDLFLLSFCMRGISFVDMAYLRKSDVRDGHIYYARRKTHQKMSVRIEPLMQDILDRWQGTGIYLLPILTKMDDADDMYDDYRNQLVQYNRHLHLLGTFLGVPLTSYVSRHSWATAARENDIPISVISQSLGHESEMTTRIYLRELDCSVIDHANSQLLDSVFEI